MRGFLIAFAVLLGVVSASVHVTFKQTLLNRLEAARKQLDVAMVNYSNQGLSSYFDVLNGLRAKFARTREVIVRVVSDDAEKGDKTAAIYEYEVRSHENTVLALLSNPNFEARIKSYAVYAAATNPKDAPMFLKTVEGLMQFQENAYKDLPSFDRIARQAATQAVQKKYAELQGILVNYKIKTQKDFDKLIQKGNDRVQQLTASGQIQEAQALHKVVIQFDHETIEMNEAMPVKRSDGVHEYYARAIMQSSTYELLEKELAPAKLINKQDLLNRLEAQEKVLEETIAKYERRSANYYVKVLGESVAQLEAVRDRVQHLPETATEKDATLTIAEVKDLEIVVPSRAQNPSPNTLLKTEAIYLAAMKDDRYPSQALIAKVNDIVKFEKEIEGQTGFSSFKMGLQAANIELSTKYYKLQASMQGQMAVRTPEENEKLAAVAARKVQELASHGHPVEAATLQNALNQFVATEMGMNRLLPINDVTVVQSYLTSAIRHNTGRNTINALLAKYAYTV